MSTQTKTPEELREERMEVKRADRIKKIHRVIERAKGPISTADISQRTGYSEPLVLSTMRLVNRTLGNIAYGRADQIMYAFDHKANGWTIAIRWDDRAEWHLTLHHHARTRCESLRAEADVAEGLWPGGAPGGLAALYQNAVNTLDQAGGMIGSLAGAAGKTATPKKARRKVKQVG